VLIPINDTQARSDLSREAIAYVVKGHRSCRSINLYENQPYFFYRASYVASGIPERAAIASAISADSHKRRAKVMGFAVKGDGISSGITLQSSIGSAGTFHKRESALIGKDPNLPLAMQLREQIQQI